jgi:hypothetical protein
MQLKSGASALSRWNLGSWPGLSVQREVMEMNVMPILLWVVFPFAVWSACFTPPFLLGKTGERPTELSGG